MLRASLAVRAAVILAAGVAIVVIDRGEPIVETTRAVAAPLLQEAGGVTQPQPPAADPTVMRSRYMLIDLDVLPAAGERRTLRQPAIPIELFGGQTIFAEFERFDAFADGMVWVGRVEGVPMSSVTLSYGGGLMTGSILMPGAVYRISPAPNEVREANREAGREAHVLAQIDQAAFPPEAPPIEEDLAALDPATAASLPMGDTDGFIDLMVVYTAAAAAHAGGEPGIANLINLGVSETNTSFANSGVHHRLRLVHTAQVPYTENSSFSVNLIELRAGAGGLAAVPGLRDAHAADLVMMLVHPVSPSACGIAFLMTSVGPGFAPNGYSVTGAGCVSPGYTFAHEIGHNMGVRHDWYMDAGTTPHTYAHGYVNPSAGQRWRTIMAYPNLCTALGVSCTRLLNWANPDARREAPCDGGRFNCSLLQYWYFPGTPMGVPGGTRTTCPTSNPLNTNCDADARRTLNETGPFVANFRQSVHGSDRR